MQNLVDVIEGAFKSRAEAERAVKAVFGGLETLAHRDETVTVRGFGTFKTKVQPGRTGRHPQTGEPFSVAARKKLVFKSSVKLG